MKPVFYVIVGVVVVVAIVRRVRGGRRSDNRSIFAGAGRALAGRLALGDTGLVAGREVRERLRGRFFKVITLVLLAVVAAAIVIPTLHSRPKSLSAARIGVVGTLSAAQARAVAAALVHVHVTGKAKSEPGLPAAEAALHAHRLTMVIDRGRSLLVDSAVSAGDSTATAVTATAIATALGLENAFTAARLSTSQARAVASAAPIPVRNVAAKKAGAATGASVIGLIFTFILLTQYLTWTLIGVMEEKASRVVEVLLATVRPIQLLGGKVLGIGVVALLQAGLVVAFALALAGAVGSDVLHGTGPAVVAASLVWLVLAYAFYSWVFAAAGSMVERQDQAQSLSLPLSVPIIVGYVLALVNAGPGQASLLLKVLAYLPPTAPFGMPLLVAKSEVSWWQFGLAALLSIACTAVVARFAATFYRRAVLRTGRRLRIRDVLTAHG